MKIGIIGLGIMGADHVTMLAARATGCHSP
jgi:3-hydroxyisobutyrate dehydrogenase-like beta-hydroxyacid dehydrogenase